MEALGNAVEPYRKSLLYAPIGIILSAIPWAVVLKVTGNIPFIDAEHLRRTLLALLYIGADTYAWIQGSNPHDAEIKTNIFHEELFLLLAGGYHVMQAQLENYKDIAFHFLSLVFIIATIVNGEGSGLANAYGFLVEAPYVFLMLSNYVQKLHYMAATWALRQFSIFVYFLSNLDLCNIGRIVFANQSVPLYIKFVLFLLLILRFRNIIEEVYELMGGKEKPNPPITSPNTHMCPIIPRRALCRIMSSIMWHN